MTYAWIENTRTDPIARGAYSSARNDERKATRSDDFTARVSLRYVVTIALSIGIASTHSTALVVLLGVLAFCALLTPTTAVMSLSLAVVLRELNPALVEQTSLTQSLAWLVVLVAAMRMLLAIRPRSLPLLVPLFGFAAVAGLTSAIASRYPTISLLKVATFGFVVAALIGGVHSLRSDQSWRCQSWYFSLGFTLIVFSLLTLALPGVAYRLNGTGFQGILNQPQAFAITIVPFTSWLAVEICLSRLGTSWRDAAILAAFCAAIVATESRTAVAALLASLCLTAAVVYLRRAYAPVRRPLLLTVVVGFLGVAMLAVSSLVSDSLPRAAEGFLRKRTDSASVVGSLDASRGHIVRSHLDRFFRHPLTGYGFGVPASNEFFEVKTFLGIPISASVEKGVAVTAVLEEVGLFGFAAVMVFILTLMRTVLRGRDFRWHALFWGCLLVNFGEAVFFSIGGSGLFFWPLICLSLNPGQHEQSNLNVAVKPCTEQGRSRDRWIASRPEAFLR